MRSTAKSADPLGLDGDLPIPVTIYVHRASCRLGIGRVRLAEVIATDSLKPVTIRRAKHVTMESVLAYVRNLREFEFDDWTSWDRLCGREGLSRSE